jgi:hypothetical protein
MVWGLLEKKLPFLVTFSAEIIFVTSVWLVVTRYPSDEAALTFPIFLLSTLKRGWVPSMTVVWFFWKIM